jgi:6-phosphogluconolactonase
MLKYKTGVMIKIWLFLVCFMSASWVYSQDGKLEKMYVGTFTSEGAEGIYLCNFNPLTGDLVQSQVFKGIDNPNFLRKSPDGKFLYVTTRAPFAVDPSGGSVVSYRINQSGALEFINKQSSQGNDPCYVDVSPDGKWVAIGNYGGGSVAIYPVNQDGSLKPASSLIKHRGSGPHPTRQKAPYAHSIRFMSDGLTLIAADLGTDQLLIYKLDKSTGILSSGDQAFVTLPPGSGPRHFEFTADEKFGYVANELNSTISVIERINGQLQVKQTLSTLPAGFKGTSFCADIHLSPDEKFVYVSNRGHQSIAVFERKADGSLSVVDHVHVQGDWPRNFTIHPSGKYMLVANQRSHNIAVFQLRDGIPVFTGKELKLPAPVCLEF